MTYPCSKTTHSLQQQQQQQQQQQHHHHHHHHRYQQQQQQKRQQQQQQQQQRKLLPVYRSSQLSIFSTISIPLLLVLLLSAVSHVDSSNISNSSISISSSNSSSFPQAKDSSRNLSVNSLQGKEAARDADTKGPCRNCTCDLSEVRELRKQTEENRAKWLELRSYLEVYVSELHELESMVRIFAKADGEERAAVAESVLPPAVETYRTASLGSSGTPSISFFVKLSLNQELKPLDTIIFDVIITNNGRAYNPNTGKFIAPLSGTYLFSVTILSAYNAKVEATLAVNEKEVTRIYAGAHDAHGSGSNAAIVRLRSGDSACVRLLQQGGGHVHSYYSTFSGTVLAVEGK